MSVTVTLTWVNCLKRLMRPSLGPESYSKIGSLNGGSLMRRVLIAAAVLWLAAASAAPEGTLTIAMHFTPVPRWLDPAEGESTITPFLLLYALHDGLLKPMPGVGSAPSLAESWSMAKDASSADFTLRANAKFHNGEPVTSEDVKF